MKNPDKSAKKYNLVGFCYCILEKSIFALRSVTYCFSVLFLNYLQFPYCRKYVKCCVKLKSKILTYLLTWTEF